jgi:serine/threonine protein kinase
VLHQIGNGVLGPVYRAQDEARDRLVAIKVLHLDAPPELAAEVAAELDDLVSHWPGHPGLVTVVAAGLEGSTPWLALEHVEWPTLDTRLRAGVRFPPDETAALVTRLADAIDASHARGIVHGGLHPRDVFVDGRGAARLSGFGLTRVLARAGLPCPIRPPYSAPELIAGRAPEPASDRFALGAIAFELVTGKRAVGTGAEAASRPALEAPDIERARTALAAMLAEEPDHRPSSAGVFARTLASAIAPNAPLVAAAEVYDSPPVASELPDSRHEASELDEDRAASQEELDLFTRQGTLWEAKQPSVRHDWDVDPDDEDALSLFAPGSSHSEALADATSDEGDRLSVAEPEFAPNADEPPVVGLREIGEDDLGQTIRDPETAPPIEIDYPVQADRAGHSDRPAGPDRTVSPDRAISYDRPDDPDRTLVADSTLSTDVLGLRSARVAPLERFDEVDEPSESFETIAPRRWTPPPDQPAPTLTSIEESSSAPSTLLLVSTLALGLALGGAGGYLLGHRSGGRAAPPNLASSEIDRETGEPRTWSDAAVGEDRAAPPEASARDAEPSQPANVPAPVPDTGPARTTEPPARPPARATPATGELIVRSTPSRAGVLVNGVWRGRTPLSIRTIPLGTHSVRVVADGHEPETRRVSLDARIPSATISVQLERAAAAKSAAPASGAPGSLYVVSRPSGARVLVDGRFRGTTPLLVPDVRPGDRTVRLEYPGRRTWTSRVTVVGGERQRVAASLEESQ